MATLRNRSRRAQTYNLPHDSYCSDGECRCSDIEQTFVHHDKGTGVTGFATQPKRLAASITFLAGETKEGLPETITKCPDVQGALARRELVELSQERT